MTIKVVEVVNMVPNKRGPVELQLSEMARQSRERGWPMTAWFPGEVPEWYAEELGAAGCQVRVTPDLNGTAGAKVVLDSIERDGASVVHLHFVRPRLYVAGLRRSGVLGIVRTEHTFLPAGSRMRSVARAYRARGVDLTIACSRYIARQTAREYRIPPKRIRLVLNGVDLQRFAPVDPEARLALRQKWLGLPAEAFVVTVAAHFTARKRIDMVIRSFPQVLAAVPGATLVLAGNGRKLESYRQLVSELSLEESVVMLTGDNLVNEIYAASDVAALTSWGEGLPGSGMEAQASGLPLVTVDAPGLDEVCDPGVSGLTAEATPEGVAQAIVTLASDEQLRREMSLAARKRAETAFDVRRTAEQTLDVYAEFSSHATG